MKKSTSTPAAALAPAPRRATRPTLRLTDDERALNDQAIDAFVTALGGRQALTDALSVGAGSDRPEIDQIATLLLDPRYAHVSLRRLCGYANLTVAELFAAYKSAMIARAHLAAYQAITDRLVPVVVDVMTRAAPYEISCDTCGGLGTVTDPDKPSAVPATCDACKGAGRLLQHPDLDRQKLALELGQLVQKSAGITLQQLNVNPAGSPAGAGAPGSLADLQFAVRTILGGPRRPLADAADRPPEPTGAPEAIALDAAAWAADTDPDPSAA